MTDSPLYHGTRRGFGVGGYLFPRAHHGGAGTSAPVNPGREVPAEADNWVYVTESIELAWAYAWAAPGRGKPKVLEVRAYTPIEPDPEHSAAAQAWRCGSAKVLRVHTDPVMTEAEAREGWLTT
jgi:hypothetical protein